MVTSQTGRKVPKDGPKVPLTGGRIAERLSARGTGTLVRVAARSGLATLAHESNVCLRIAGGPEMADVLRTV